MVPPSPTRRPLILVAGAAGRLGRELVRALAPLGTVSGLAPADLDFARPRAVRDFFRAVHPALIVNAVAAPADEADEARRWAINVAAPAHLAAEAARYGAPVIHLSTAAVLGADRADGPLDEAAAPAPASVDAASRLAGEDAVRDAGGPHLIVRLGWTFGARDGLLPALVRIARERGTLHVADGAPASPTCARAAAQAIALLVAACRTPDGPAFAVPAERAGLYHLAGPGAATLGDLAARIAAAVARHAGRPVDLVLRRGTAGAAGLVDAAQPAGPALAADRLAGAFGIALPPWIAQLAGALDDVGVR